MKIPPHWFTWFVVIWAVLFGFSLVRRLYRLKGKPGGLVEPRPEEIIYNESFASATSHKSRMTRLGGGSFCMRISITAKALFIRPHFPFSLVGWDADLIHEIPLSTISEVMRCPKSIMPTIIVRFGECRVDLIINRPNEFLATISPLIENAKKSER